MAGRVLKVYLAASMRGGGEGKGWDSLRALAEIVSSLGHTPMNEVCKDRSPKVQAKGKGDDYLYDRDMAWLRIADCLIAEVTYPSLGVGYEVAVALREMRIPVLALCNDPLPELSAMFNGNTEPLLHLVRCSSSDEMQDSVRRFLGKITKRGT
jgi:hypothetical protein